MQENWALFYRNSVFWERGTFFFPRRTFPGWVTDTWDHLWVTSQPFPCLTKQFQQAEVAAKETSNVGKKLSSKWKRNSSLLSGHNQRCYFCLCSFMQRKFSSLTLQHSTFWFATWRAHKRQIQHILLVHVSQMMLGYAQCSMLSADACNVFEIWHRAYQPAD